MTPHTAGVSEKKTGKLAISLACLCGLAVGSSLGFVAVLGYGLGQAGQATSALFGWSWFMGGASVGASVGGFVALLFGSTLGPRFWYVFGAGLAWVPWTIVSEEYRFGWSDLTRARLSFVPLVLGPLVVLTIRIVARKLSRKNSGPGDATRMEAPRKRKG